MTKPATIEAEYEVQYELKVTSVHGNPQGSGWYDQGSAATFSVTSPTPLEGFLGILGGKYVFDRWSGGSSATTATASVTMDGPRTVTAVWRTDNTTPYAIIGSIVIIAALAVLVKKRGSSTTPRHESHVVALDAQSESQPRRRADVLAPETQTRDTRYVEYLARLEELRTRGEISEETYKKLKDEYWKRITEKDT